jgi:hypothetical protein
MRIPIHCPECLFKNPAETRPTFLSPTDDDRYKITCEAGHTTVTFLQQQRFEVLFQLGATAIVDGYYREAISSFASSLERFYEFAIRSLAIETGRTPDALNASWKSISNQSERQLGAFIFSWLLCFGEMPKILTSTETNFRNKVIHQGKLPARDEALAFGETILSLIRPHMYKLIENAKNGVDTEMTRVNLQKALGIPGDLHSQTNLSMPTLISLVMIDDRQQTMSLADYLPIVERWLNSAKC